MVENVTKRRRVRSLALLGVLLGLCIAAAVVWLLYYHNRTYLSDAVANVDGTIETGSNAVELALKGLSESAPADIIQGAPGETTRVGLVFVGLTEEADTNHAVLELIKQNGLKASFALSAAEALDNEDFLTDMLAEGNELLSNGAAGESNLHTKTTQEMVSTMLKSREAIATAANESVPLLYCSSTALTGDVLRAASVSGYEAVVQAADSHVLSESSFEAAVDAESFVAGLQGDAVVVVNLRGVAEEIQNEDAVTAEKPAIDKQPELDDTKQPEDEKADILTQVNWLVQALKAQDMKTEYVSHFSRVKGLDVLRSEAEAADAEMAPIYRSCLTNQKQAGVAIRTLPSADGMDAALEILTQQNITATYFATVEEAAARSEELARLEAAGCSVGLYLPAEQLKGLSRTAVFDKLYDALCTFESASGLVLADAQTDAEALTSLRVAARLLNTKIVMPENPEQMQAGSLYLLDTLDTEHLSALKQQAEQAGLQLTDLATVIQKSGTLPTLTPQELSALRKQNDHKLATAQNIVYTTERAVSFAFYGLRNTTAAADAANRLRSHGGTGTFFVTLNELMTYSGTIEHILGQGHELGIYYQATSDYPQTFDAMVNYLNSWKKYAAWRYGVDSNVVLMASDTATEEAKEAISTSGCSLIKNTFLVVKNEDKNMTLDDLPAAVERISSMRVMRGAFVCFNMDFYTNDRNATENNTILGAVLDAFIENHVDTLAYRSHDTGEIEDASRFAITTVSHVLSSKQKYRLYPTEQTDISMDKNVLNNMETEEDRFRYIAQRYYGNVTVDTKAKLPGFTGNEIRQLDKKGTFTDDKVLFLTFDDWGTEQSINELLYVLEKHNVKATFFIRTGYVDANPNLLRTIAVQGHQIASHTDNHIPLADSVNESGNLMASLTDAEALALRRDLVTSYQKLYKYTGDVVVNGKHSLSRMFRPPTLAVSKIGLTQVFDTGFSYSISGAYSTGDYEAVSYEDMIERLTRRSIGGGKYVTVHNGTVMVMHMQENAKYTAQALDTMIPYWQQQGYTFARIDDYLSE